MEVTGKLTERKGHTLGGACVGDEVTIELPPVDVSKIKEGDKVWVEIELMLGKLSCVPQIRYLDLPNDIVAHFPQPNLTIKRLNNKGRHK